jgi:hypothetical protein
VKAPHQEATLVSRQVGRPPEVSQREDGAGAPAFDSGGIEARREVTKPVV